ncbi:MULTISPECIES: hypothetical protein [Muribaculaceae]|uniref:hypothetical protein n=1 Tax=Muribaculaceae TaxID=2005473 RepID=UPI00244DF8F5|nr:MULTISPECIES: hypothetical protein [Muribaculaceae]
MPKRYLLCDHYGRTVTIVFAMTTGVVTSVRVCLYAALGFAIVAGLFSLSRAGGVREKI